MSYIQKVIPYIAKGSECKETVGGDSFLVRPTKMEMAFRPFANRESSVTSVVSTIAEDPILRQFLFTKAEFEIKPKLEYQLTRQTPLFVTFDRDFLESAHEKLFEKQIEEITDQRSKAEENAKDAGLSIMYEALKSLLGDREFRNRLRKDRLPRGTDADDYFSKVFNRQETDLNKIYKSMVEFQESTAQVNENLQPVIYALEKSTTAMKNHEIMHPAVKLPENHKIFADSLSKLEAKRIFKLNTLAVCLECYLRKNLDPNVTAQLHTGRPEFVTLCNKCAGKSIVTSIEFEIPVVLSPSFQEHHIQELVVGYTIAQLESVKSVYIHKNIVPISNGITKKSREVDILILTHDERKIAIEVTTTNDISQVYKKSNVKKDILSDLGFDNLAYISASTELEHPSQYGPFMLLGANHLPKLNEVLSKRFNL